MNNFQRAIDAFQRRDLDNAFNFAKTLHKKDSNYASAMQLCGVIRFNQQHYVEANKFLQIANKLNRHNPEVLNALAACAIELNQFPKAETHLKEALKHQPNYTDAQKNLALVKEKQNKLEDAFDLYLNIIRRDATQTNLLPSLMRTATTTSQREKLKALFIEYLKANNNNAQLKSLYAQFLVDNEQYDSALQILDQLASNDPSNLTIQALTAFCLKELGQFSAARQLYSTIIENTSSTNDQEFIKKLKSNLALVELTLENYAVGWDYYRYRPSLLFTQLPLYQHKLPSDLKDKNILVVRDQGLGDELFFLRFLPELERRGGNTTYFSSEKLAPVLSLASDISQINTEVKNLESYDYVVSIGDLPYVLDFSDNIPPPLPLQVNPNALCQFKEQLGLTRDIKRIGITWRAGTDKENNLATSVKKSIPLDVLISTLESFKGEVYILQRYPEEQEIQTLNERLSADVIDVSALNEDLLSMTYMLSVLDDYLAVSNTNVHIRGSLGKKAQVLVPFPPEWRWGFNKSTSSWYKYFTIHHSTEDGQWSLPPQLLD